MKSSCNLINLRKWLEMQLLIGRPDIQIQRCLLILVLFLIALFSSLFTSVPPVISVQLFPLSAEENLQVFQHWQCTIAGD